MPVSYIETFSSNLNPCKITTNVEIIGRTISIYPDTIDSGGAKFFIEEKIDIEIPEVIEKSNLRIHFVEDLSTKEMIVVMDLNIEYKEEWTPNPSTHRIIHNLIYGNIIPGNQPLESSSICIYLKNPPKQHI